METSLIHRQERFLLKIGWTQTTAPEQKETRERERKDKRARQWSQRNIGPGLDSHTLVELQDNSRTPRNFTTKGDVCYVYSNSFFSFHWKIQNLWVPVGQEVVSRHRVGPLRVDPMHQPSPTPSRSQSCLQLPGGELLECLSQMGLNMISNNKGLIIGVCNCNCNIYTGARWILWQCQLQLQLRWCLLWTR